VCSADQNRHPAKQPGDAAQDIGVKHVTVHNVRVKTPDERSEARNRPQVRHSRFHVEGMNRNELRLEQVLNSHRLNQADYRNLPASRFQLARKVNDLPLCATDAQRGYNEKNSVWFRNRHVIDDLVPTDLGC
jgi:hypothetical protein